MSRAPCPSLAKASGMDRTVNNFLHPALDTPHTLAFMHAYTPALLYACTLTHLHAYTLARISAKASGMKGFRSPSQKY
jgi:hypothetical protein